MTTRSPEISPIQTRPPIAEPTIVTFGVSDPEVLLALSEYPEGQARTNFLVTALKVGVLSLKAARGTLDADNVRREGDRLMDQLTERLNGWREQLEDRVTHSLSHYFDPKQGLFMERVDRLTRQDGELSGVVKQQVREAELTLAKVFEQFVGDNSQLLQLLDPSGDNKLIQQLQQALDGVVKGAERRHPRPVLAGQQARRDGAVPHGADRAARGPEQGHDRKHGVGRRGVLAGQAR